MRVILVSADVIAVIGDRGGLYEAHLLAEILEVDHIDVFHVAFADLAQVRLRCLNAASVAVTWLQSHGARSRWATSMTLLTRLCEKSLTKLSARS